LQKQVEKTLISSSAFGLFGVWNTIPKVWEHNMFYFEHNMFCFASFHVFLCFFGTWFVCCVFIICFGLGFMLVANAFYFGLTMMC
jgi:hypothetical protein